MKISEKSKRFEMNKNFRVGDLEAVIEPCQYQTDIKKTTAVTAFSNKK